MLIKNYYNHVYYSKKIQSLQKHVSCTSVIFMSDKIFDGPFIKAYNYKLQNLQMCKL